MNSVKSKAKLSVKSVYQGTESLQKHSSGGARPTTLLKKKTLAQVFSCEFCEISKNTFSYRRPPMAASESFLFKAKSLRYTPKYLKNNDV